MLSKFSAAHRQQAIKNFESEVYDIVIVGGGIVGAGVARDAASRGMKVALVEAQDFAQGTSSRSSKLIHGGIRYLENFEFGLVFEALRERHVLFEIAPHLVHPLRFIIPLFKGGRYSLWQMGLGMWAYDLLALFDVPELHSTHFKDSLTQEIPFLQTDGLLGGCEYSDAYMDDDRLTIETLRSAHDFGADIANFVQIESCVRDSNGIQKLLGTDRRSGKKLSLTGRHFVSAVGPWTDIFGPVVSKSWKRQMRPTKGVHITLHRNRVPLQKAVVMAAEKRIVFAIPRHEMVIIGTTDTDYTGDPSQVTATFDDVQYLLSVTARYFPGLKINQGDILATYAGVRPLVDDGSDSAGKTSREHKIFSEGNLTFVTGGKYTTYRNISYQVVKEVLSHFTIAESVQWGRNQTHTPINPEATIEKTMALRSRLGQLSNDFMLSAAEVEFLVSRHSGEIERILNVGRDYLTESVQSRVWQIEAAHAIENTMCFNLIDFYMRRSPLYLSHSNNGLEHLAAIANVFKNSYGWSDQELEKQVNALHEFRRVEQLWNQSK